MKSKFTIGLVRVGFWCTLVPTLVFALIGFWFGLATAYLDDLHSELTYKK